MKKIIFLFIICLILFGLVWGCCKYNAHIKSKADLFIVDTKDCGWNTLIEKPTRINNINNIWQIRFEYKGKQLVAFGNCEQPTKHWEIGDEVLIVEIQSDPSTFFSPPIYFFNNHRKARKKVEEMTYTQL